MNNDAASLETELDAIRRIDDTEADELLVGAVDLHTHPAPSPFPRRMTILEAAADAAANGFRAVVAKSHHHSMQPDILALGPVGLDMLDIDVFGGVALNSYTGGINPFSVELALSLGGRIVWFPTLSSTAHVSHNAGGGAFPSATIRLRDPLPVSIFDDRGVLTSNTYEVLDLIAEHDAILNCGHLPAEQIDALIPAARVRGVQRIIVSHPHFIVDASAEQTRLWADQGAYIEHCLPFLVTGERSGDLGVFEPYLDAVGIERTIFSSDLGQPGNPLPLTAYRVLVRALLDAGYSGNDIARMIATNPGVLLYRNDETASSRS